MEEERRGPRRVDAGGGKMRTIEDKRLLQIMPPTIPTWAAYCWKDDGAWELDEDGQPLIRYEPVHAWGLIVEYGHQGDPHEPYGGRRTVEPLLLSDEYGWLEEIDEFGLGEQLICMTTVQDRAHVLERMKALGKLESPTEG